MERCKYLHGKYEDKLSLVYFSISKISRLSKSEWIKWLQFFDDKIKEIKNKD